MLTTAAHAAREYGAKVEVEGLGSATVVRVVWERSVDMSLLEPDFDLPDSACKLPGGLQLAGGAPPTTVGSEVYLFRGGASAPSKVKVASVGRLESIAGPNFNAMRIGPLIGTPAFTDHGDSGALLFDAGYRALATLVGELNGVDYFLPITPLLSPLDLTLET